MTVVHALVVILLGCAAAMTIYRLARGPSMLDRAVAFDVLTAVAMCAVGTAAAVYRDYTAMPVLLVLSLLGFVGSVCLARFFARSGR
ncbi:monovalent cation/H+ antiporter complex subunit F [Nonomuraea sp. NPDC050790]|uniref:monovalent cation/H+ antiporter complex subunit F n=1 Tax=Nonomuraea sp. NPDC050790 TaxID=3364371 RepID=UPI0037A0BB78